MTTTGARLTAEDLDHFRTVQRLAYQCAETIAGELQPGMTEREAAALQKRGYSTMVLMTGFISRSLGLVTVRPFAALLVLNT